MASQVFGNLLYNMAISGVNLSNGGDTFNTLLVSVAPTESDLDSDTGWNDRADVTNELATANGYTAGGKVSNVSSISYTDTPDGIDINFTDPAAWSAATITAVGAIIYKSTGTAANDILVAYVDFGGEVVSTNGDFAVSFSTPLSISIS